MESCTGHATDAVEDESRSCRHSTSLCRLAPEEAGEAGGDDAANPKLPLPPLADPARSSIRNAANAAENGGVRHAGEDAADGSPERLTTTTAPTATATSANVSTHEQEELARFHQRKGVAGTPPVASGPQTEEPFGDSKRGLGSSGASPAADREKPAGDIGLVHAVLAAAQELVHHCQVPGISEAASAVPIMANLVMASRENDRAGESRLRQCRSIVMALKRAEKVVAKVR